MPDTNISQDQCIQRPTQSTGNRKRGRPRLPLTDEERAEARRARVRRNVQAFRQRRREATVSQAEMAVLSHQMAYHTSPQLEHLRSPPSPRSFTPSSICSGDFGETLSSFSDYEDANISFPNVMTSSYEDLLYWPNDSSACLDACATWFTQSLPATPHISLAAFENVATASSSLPMGDYFPDGNNRCQPPQSSFDHAFANGRSLQLPSQAQITPMQSSHQQQQASQRHCQPEYMTYVNPSEDGFLAPNYPANLSTTSSHVGGPAFPPYVGGASLPFRPQPQPQPQSSRRATIPRSHSSLKDKRR